MSAQNENKAITIYDIAKEAGVSAATVSRVLTNSTNVREEKRKKVMELVEKYNFKPNAMAKGLADTKSKIIGILAADVRNPYYAELFVSCEQAAKNAGYTVLLSNSLNDKEQEEHLLGKLQEQGVDAIIQLGGRVDDLISNLEYVEKVNQVMARTPVVVSGKLDGTKCRIVRIDSMKAMELIMDHLIFLGHRQIALIGGDMDVLSTYEKFVQYKHSLSSNQIEFDPELIYDGGAYSAEGGYALTNKMLSKGKIPTAVVAINDQTAAGVIKSIQEHGYRIPEDISVASYDNTLISKLVTPTLTTIDYNYDEFGRKLIEAAIEAVEGKDGEILQIVTPKLILRKSTGTVREKA